MKPSKSAACGCLLISASGLLLLFIFGVSTLSGGEFPDGGAEWWSAVLGTMFRSPDPGTITYACIAALLLGLYLCLRPPGARSTIRRMMAWVAIVAVVLGVLLWSASKEHVVMVGREPRPDGSTVETIQYANFFGLTRKVERVER
jgi:predicted permease